MLHFDGSITSTLTYYSRADFDSMVDGTASRPYVGRMLVPLVVQGIERATTTRATVVSTQNKVVGDVQELGPVARVVRWVFLSKDFVEEFNMGDYARARGFPYRVAIYCMLAVLMLWGVALGGRAAHGALYGPSRADGVAGLILLLTAPLWCRYIAYVYDPMTLLLGVWIIYAAARSNVWLCCVLFVLACVNKETAPLVLPVILYGIRRRHDLYATVAAGFGLAVAAALVQTYRLGTFANNPGAWTEHHWVDHQLVVFSQYTMSLLWAVVVVGGCLWLALMGAKQKPVLLRIGLITVLLPLFAASLAFGFLDESRALFDAFPYVMLMAMPTALGYLGLLDSPEAPQTVTQAI